MGERKVTQRQRIELLSPRAVASCSVECRTNLVRMVKAKAQWDYFK